MGKTLTIRCDRKIHSVKCGSLLSFTSKRQLFRGTNLIFVWSGRWKQCANCTNFWWKKSRKTKNKRQSDPPMFRSYAWLSVMIRICRYVVKVTWIIFSITLIIFFSITLLQTIQRFQPFVNSNGEKLWFEQWIAWWSLCFQKDHNLFNTLKLDVQADRTSFFYFMGFIQKNTTLCLPYWRFQL